MRNWRFVAPKVHRFPGFRSQSRPVHVTVDSENGRRQLLEAMNSAGMSAVSSSLSPPVGVEYVTVAGADLDQVLCLRDVISVDRDDC